jgi:predicted PurR-regulated permease PerM
MTGWDVLDKVISSFPPIVMALILVAVLVAVVIFIVGFSRHGANFLKYGFKQSDMSNLLEKLATKEDIGRIDARLDSMDTRIAAIETNHFGHLKEFLTELTSILLDKGVINNQDKARLDNKLRGM